MQAPFPYLLYRNRARPANRFPGKYLTLGSGARIGKNPITERGRDRTARRGLRFALLKMAFNRILDFSNGPDVYLGLFYFYYSFCSDFPIL
jgi:hypothetical protein